ncbi:hypothetical protein B4Q13_23575, partial [Lacticaseibacillus rhamnosus]
SDNNLFTNPTLDTDGDGLLNFRDPDSDNDGIIDGQDNCPLVVNPGQEDTDGDGKGDVCDGDSDGDGVRLFTRRGYDWTGRYPAIAATAAKLRAKSFTLDGEAVGCGPVSLRNIEFRAL